MIKKCLTNEIYFYAMLVINHIKNIKKAEFELPLEKGVYALVGINGSGKSTVLQALAQNISRHHLGMLNPSDYNQDSFVSFHYNGKTDKWKKSKDMWVADSYPNTLKFNGNYEGSLFYGARFNDSRVVDELLESGAFKEDEIVPADKYVIEKMSYIIHEDTEHYKNLKKVRNKYIAQRNNLKNTPYFIEANGKLISQYRMSSGECLLLSLLHFVYNSIERRSLPTNETILLLIDEIEVALHPAATKRLLELLNGLVEKSENLVVYLTTHSPEVIRFIHPNRLFKFENINGELKTINPCYPSYAIRDMFDPDGYDFLLLVEDKLAKIIIEKILNVRNLRSSRLIHTCPIGGWEQVLDFHQELLNSKLLGIGTIVISILDGDIRDLAAKKKTSLKKLFLPIESVEKYLYRIIIGEPNIAIKKVINDKYFPLNSVDKLVAQFKTKHGNELSAKLNKEFYAYLLQDLRERGISERDFINNLADDIMRNVDFTAFITQMEQMLS